MSVGHPLRYHAKGRRCLRNSKEWDDVGVGNPLPHHHLLAEYLMPMVSTGVRCKRRKTKYLSNFLYVFILVHPEGLYRHSFIIVDAFPNIGKTARGGGTIGRLDEFSRNDVGVW